MARDIRCRVWFDWDLNGTFTQETDNLVSVDGNSRFTPPGETLTSGRGIVDQCRIELRNAAGRYSSLNTSSPLYAYTQNGGTYHVPAYVEIAIDGSAYTRVFTGVTKIPNETGKSWGGIQTVVFDCRGRDELLLQRRISTSQASFRTRHEAGWNEAQIIDAFAAAGGVSGGDRIIDAGMVSIPWSYIDDESILEEIWSLAAAAGGRVYFDRNGKMRYENMAHWLFAPHNTSQATYTGADWQKMEVAYEDKNLYDSISVEYSGRKVEPETSLWEPDDPVRIAANSSSTITANFSYPVYTQPVITYKAHTAGGVNMAAYVTVTPTWYAQRATLVITNSHTMLGVNLSAFAITGRPVVGGPSADESRNSAEHGSNGSFFTGRQTSRNYSVRGNFYVQSRAQANMIAQFLLDRYERPCLVYKLRGMPGDPVRIPGDRVTINDASAMSSPRDAIVTGVTWRYGEMSYAMDIEAVDAVSLYPFLGASPGYFVIGTNRLGAADALRGRCFY